MDMIDQTLVTNYSKMIALLDQDDPEYFGKMMDVTDSFLEINDLLKSSRQPQLEDLREGPHSGCSLKQAEQKLAFNLQNDRDLYDAYQYFIVNKMAVEFVESRHVSVKDEDGLRLLIDICEKTAQEVLDSYIETLVD